MNTPKAEKGLATGACTHAGRVLVKTWHNAMNPNNISQNSSTPPPDSKCCTPHLAVNGQATRPYELSVLKQMADAGQFTADSLVWKNGMAEWVKAGTVDELKAMFVVMPPIPPTE